MIPFPDKKYKIIYADPPWEYGNYSNMGDPVKCKRLGIQPKFKITPYSGMSIEAIKALPVRNIAEDDSVLLMWITWPCLLWAEPVMKSWGFEYRTLAFNWVKKNKNGVGWFFGLGNYTRANSEICLLGRRGKGCKVINKKVEQILDNPLTEHSEKPNEARLRIVKLFGDLSRIELFARTKIHGWDTWGNDPMLEHEPLEAFSTLGFDRL